MGRNKSISDYNIIFVRETEKEIARKLEEERKRWREEKAQMQEHIDRLKKRGDKLQDLLQIYHFVQSFEEEKAVRKEEEEDEEEEAGQVGGAVAGSGMNDDDVRHAGGVVVEDGRSPSKRKK